MNVDKVVHIITGLDDGGAESVLYRLCLSTLAQTVAVISLSSPGKYSDLLRLAGIEVIHLNMPRGRLTASGLWTLHKVLRRRQPDVVQTWMYHGDLIGGVVARFAGCRKVFWNIRHSDLRPQSTGRSTRLVAMLCARLSKTVPSGIVACAERAQRVHTELGYDASKFTVIHNGYGTAQFRPDPLLRARVRGELNLSEDEPVIGFVARWNPQKDHGNLLEAVSGLVTFGKASVILVGHGCDEANVDLAELIERSGLVGRVRLLGRRNDIPALMNAFDVHVLPSSHGEAFPNVVAEAMACGTPCVVTDVGDAPLIVGETGWVVPPGNAEALSQALVTALQERSEVTVWNQRQNAARSRIVENFSLDKMVAGYTALWAQRSLS